MRGDIVKENQLQHRRAPKEAHTTRPRSVKSKVSRYLVAGSLIFTLGCAGKAVNPQVASLVNVPMAQKKSQVMVTPDKQGPVVQDKEEISITELKDYQLKFKEKQGSYYETVLDNEGFYMDVAVKKPIELEDGKKSLVVIVTITNDEEKLKKGGHEAGSIFIRLIDNKQKKVVSAWAPDFDKLRKEYKEMTGKNLMHVHVIVEHDKDELGEYVQFHIIPASSKKAVDKGIIESGMPVYMVGVYPNSGTGKWETGTNLKKITASMNSEDDSVVAQK